MNSHIGHPRKIIATRRLEAAEKEASRRIVPGGRLSILSQMIKASAIRSTPIMKGIIIHTVLFFINKLPVN